MNNEQTIDDILKLLKEAVENDYSDEELQKQLKKQYANKKDTYLDREGSPYALDYEFLKEVGGDEALSVSPSSSEQMPSSGKNTAGGQPEKKTSKKKTEENAAPKKAKSKPKTVKTVKESGETGSEKQTNDIDLPPWEVPEEESTQEAGHTVSAERKIEKEDTVSPVATKKAEDTQLMKSEEAEEAIVEIKEEAFDVSENDELGYDEFEEAFGEAFGEAFEDKFEDSFEYEEYPEIEQIELNELLKDYDLPDDSIVGEEEYPSAQGVTEEASSTTTEKGTIAEEQDEKVLDPSVYDLMLQFGCEEELDIISEMEIPEEMARNRTQEDSLDDGEYRSYTQTEELYSAYNKRNTRFLLRLLGTCALVILLFFYDTLPVFRVEFAGLANYEEYPGAYIFIGLQLLIFCALPFIKSLFVGLKRLLTLKANLYSMAALLLIFNIVYDVTVALIPTDLHLPMFHFVTSMIMLGVEINDYVLFRREMKCFSVYSSNEAKNKYTLKHSTGRHAMAEKMYGSGLDSKISVYSAEQIDFPSGFFRSMGENAVTQQKISLFILPAILIGIATSVVAMILNENITVAAISVMAVTLVALPVSMIASACFSMAASASRLKKRGIAITGNETIERYKKGDMLVFQDTHFFKKCNAKDIGIVFYEQEQAAKILAALQRLYELIGGPMSTVFSDMPDSCRFDDARIRRIMRNGIEMLIDKKHILLVGDYEYMRRYGLSFSEEEARGGRGVLYISFDGKASAKMNIQYALEPIAEMLVERMAKEGLQCTVETYDPMIQAGIVASTRRLGKHPISVVHKNARDLYRKGKEWSRNQDDVGILALASRLKLAEAAVWCRRLQRIDRFNTVLSILFGVVGVFSVWSVLLTKHITVINQYWLLLFAVIFNGIAVLLSLLQFPSKKYFTIDACQKELARKNRKKKKDKTLRKERKRKN